MIGNRQRTMEKWLRDVAQKTAENWFSRQARNSCEKFYIYHHDASQDEEPWNHPPVIVSENLAAVPDGYELSWHEHIRRDYTKQQAAYRLYEIMQKLPIFPKEIINQ